MKLIALFLLLCAMVNATINVCKFQYIPSPSSLSGLYQCTIDAVNDRICLTTNDYYQKVSCAQQSGGAVNIFIEFETRFLLLGTDYAAHYLQVHA